MLAVHNEIDAVTLQKSPTVRAAVARALDAANDDAANDDANDNVVDEVDRAAMPVGESDHRSDGPLLNGNWLSEWCQIWAAAASTMVDASAASAGSTPANNVMPRPEPRTSELSLWLQPASSERPRSWYRPPQPNLLDPTTWGFPAPFSIYGVPVTPPMGFNPMMQPSWSPFSGALSGAVGPFSNWMQPAASMAWIGFGWPSFGSAFNAGFGSSAYLPSPYANPFSREPANPLIAWLESFAPKPVNPWMNTWVSPSSNTWNSVTKSVTDTHLATPYAAYRSDSGHAVAQIAEFTPSNTPSATASSAQQATDAIWALFAWPTTTN